MIGIDVVTINKVKAVFERHGKKFPKKILDQSEVNEISASPQQDSAVILSVYIAAKEAIYKAIALPNLGWKDVVIHGITSMPIIHVNNVDMTARIRLSFTISKRIVIALAIFI